MRISQNLSVIGNCCSLLRLFKQVPMGATGGLELGSESPLEGSEQQLV